MDNRALRDTIAGRISVAMTRQRLTPNGLAKIANVSEGTMRRVLEGHNTSLDVIVSIAAALDLSLPELVTARQSQ